MPILVIIGDTKVVRRNMQTANSLPELKAKPLVSGAILIGVGCMTALAGLILGGSHLLSATRKWVQEMDMSPAELAKAKWAQARAATSAGADAWRAAVPVNAQAHTS
jgi:hypothetical protein